MKQHWKILIAFGIFGLLLGVGRAAFEDSFGKLSTVSVIIFTLVVVLGVSFIQVRPTLKLRKKLFHIIDAFEEGGSLDEYIENLQTLIDEPKSMFDTSYANNQIVLKNNLAVGYMFKGDFYKGKSILSDLNIRRFKGPTRAAYLGNLTYCLFMTDEKKQAVEIMKNNMDVFKSFYKMPNVGTVINICFIYLMIEEQRFDSLEFYIKEADDTTVGVYQKEWLEETKDFLYKRGYWSDEEEIGAKTREEEENR